MAKYNSTSGPALRFISIEGGAPMAGLYIALAAAAPPTTGAAAANGTTPALVLDSRTFLLGGEETTENKPPSLSTKTTVPGSK